jgi:hypothetical protein
VKFYCTPTTVLILLYRITDYSDRLLGLGKQCINLPLSIPNGTVARACCDICTKWGIPTGVVVWIEVAGARVVEQTFGS